MSPIASAIRFVDPGGGAPWLASSVMSAGRFSPLIGAVVPLAHVDEAHALMDEGRVIGKVIVKPEA